MYAVIESGGKQYRVELGTELTVDRLSDEPGAVVQLERVLLVADDGTASVGRPVVEGARVSASIVRHDRGEKIVVFKYRPKARRRVKRGHRQEQTVLRIADIVLGTKSAAREAEAARVERARLDAAQAKEAARQAAADKALADKLAREADSEAGTESGAATARSRPRLPRARGGQKLGDDAAAGASAAKSATVRRPRKPTLRTQAPEPATPEDKDDKKVRRPRRTTDEQAKGE